MPVTKTAKRAQRSSKKKEAVNKKILADLDSAIRLAKRDKKSKLAQKAISLADRAVKKNIIHRNKAARIKSSLSKYLKLSKKTKTVKRTTKKTPAKKK